MHLGILSNRNTVDERKKSALKCRLVFARLLEVASHRYNITSHTYLTN
jgi:hypothetical protein